MMLFEIRAGRTCSPVLLLLDLIDSLWSFLCSWIFLLALGL